MKRNHILARTPKQRMLNGKRENYGGAEKRSRNIICGLSSPATSFNNEKKCYISP
jgi:hypothetical protein